MQHPPDENRGFRTLIFFHILQWFEKTETPFSETPFLKKGVRGYLAQSAFRADTVRDPTHYMNTEGGREGRDGGTSLFRYTSFWKKWVLRLYATPPVPHLPTRFVRVPTFPRPQAELAANFIFFEFSVVLIWICLFLVY